MSYDLEIWSTKPVERSLVPEPDAWTSSGSLLQREGNGWVVSLGDSTPVLAEDIPDGAENLLPGIAFLTELSLSPIGAPKSAYEVMNRTATVLAKAAHGLTGC
jgi:hypothetical protein